MLPLAPPASPQLLATAVAALGGTERTGQVEMAEAVEHAFEYRRAPRRARRAPAPASRWPTWCPRSRGPSPPTSPSWCRPRPSRCSASWSIATSRGSPTHWPRLSRAAPTSRCSRDAVTTCVSTRSTTAPERAGGRLAGGAVRRSRDDGARPRRAAAHRVGVGHRDRRPRRDRARRARPVMGSGQRVRPRVPRRDALPVRNRLLRREGPRQGRPRRCRRHQPRAARHRRHRRRQRAARARPARRRRGARTRRPGHQRRHRRTVRHRRSASPTAARPGSSNPNSHNASKPSSPRSPRRSTTPNPAASTPSTTSSRPT